MIPLIKPELPDMSKWIVYLQSSYDSCHFSNNGPCVSLLENRLGEYLGAEASPLLVANATTGLITAIKALDLTDCEILVPSFTFAATALAITNTGNTPVFVDIDDDLFFSITDAELKITKNTKALIVVHTLGAIPDNEKYERFAEKHGLKLIFDAATTFGLSYQSNKIGMAGDVEVFSFHATKTFGVGEGGLLSSKSSELLDRARSIVNFGFDENSDVSGHGFNGKMSELPAAVGLAMLDELPARFIKRNKIADMYQMKLLGNKKIKIYDTPARQMTVVVFKENKERDFVIKAFAERKIGCKIYYRPLHVHTFFKSNIYLPKTDDAFSKCLSIPMYDSMTESDIDEIVEVLNGVHDE